MTKPLMCITRPGRRRHCSPHKCVGSQKADRLFDGTNALKVYWENALGPLSSHIIRKLSTHSHAIYNCTLSFRTEPTTSCACKHFIVMLVPGKGSKLLVGISVAASLSVHSFMGIIQGKVQVPNVHLSTAIALHVAS